MSDIKIQTDRYSKSIVYFKNAGIVWMIIGLLAGLLNEVQLMTGVPGAESPLSYGKLKAIANNSVIFGGVLSFLLGYGLRILNSEGKRQKIDIIGQVSFFLLQLGLISGIAVFASGISAGREYGEFNYHSDNLILLSIVIVLALSIFNLNGEKLSAVAQFLLVTLTGMIVSFFFGNFGFPNSFLTSVAPTSGIQDAMVQEYYRMAVLTFFVYLPLLTILYQALPEKIGAEIQSMPAVRFQLIVSILLVPIAGGAALLYSVAPISIQVLGSYTAAALALSVLAGTVNLHQSFNSVKDAKSDGVVLAIRLGGLAITVMALLQFVTRLPIAKHYLQYTTWNDVDPFFTATTVGLAALFVAASMITSNGKRSPAKWVLILLSAGIVLVLPAALLQGLFEGISALSLSDDGTKLVHSKWSAISSITALTGKSNAVKYLVSLNGLGLLAKLCIFIAFFPILSFLFEDNDEKKAA